MATQTLYVIVCPNHDARSDWFLVGDWHGIGYLFGFLLLG
jgi:hypothetical protein